MPDVRFIASNDWQCQETFPLSSGYLPVLTAVLDMYLWGFTQCTAQQHSPNHNKWGYLCKRYKFDTEFD